MGKKSSKSKNHDTAQEISKLKNKLSTITSTENIKKFTDLPLSELTLNGLTQWQEVTDIQREAILPALRGQNLLAAAKTGSGKTLAFLIPVVESLYWAHITHLDGLTALIVSPTRELASQIYKVLDGICSEHVFTRGLLIGGEKTQLKSSPNIIVGTPGRLLEFLEEGESLNLRVLVLDEADRILDLGFSETLNYIIELLPQKRQNLLFSATLTKSVTDLSRLHVTSPLYISVHEHSEFSTPNGLKQKYIKCGIGQKMSVLCGLVMKKRRMIVFLSTCKQVRYLEGLLKAMRIKVGCLHGGMKQHQRSHVCEEFENRNYSALIATDLAARGLDFAAVDWVIQLDCPDSVDSYIHRVGRTARYQNRGHSLLVLLDSELTFVEKLLNQRIPIIEINCESHVDVTSRVQSCCANSPELNDACKKAILSYSKWVFYAADKELFDVKKLNLAEFSRSMGLSVTPRLRFLEKQLAVQSKAVDGKSKARKRKISVSGTTGRNKSRKTDSLENKSLAEIEALASKFL